MEKKEVPLEKLTIQQLDYVGKTLEQEVNSLSGSYTTFKVALTKYSENLQYLKELVNTQDKELLIPLSSSVYLPGRSKDINRVMVDLGAQYFLETTVDKALEFTERKIKFIHENMDKVDESIKTKNSYLHAINQQIILKQAAESEKANEVKK